MKLTAEIMRWNYEMKLTNEIMRWNHEMKLWDEIMRWNYEMKRFEIMAVKCIMTTFVMKSFVIC